MSNPFFRGFSKTLSQSTKARLTMPDLFFQRFSKIFEGITVVEPLPRTVLNTLPVLHTGMSSETLQAAIDKVQQQLIKRGLLAAASGKFDEDTEKAVEFFQQCNKLCADGVVGPLTWAAMLYPTLSQGDELTEATTEGIQTLQALLKEEGFLAHIDGRFDQRTKQALKRFQQVYGLESDGICGPVTWSMLLGQRPKVNFEELKLQFNLWRLEFVLEQLFIVIAIQAGIHSNPFDFEHTYSFFDTLVIAYGLTCICPPLLDYFNKRLFHFQSFPILRYAPYVIVGFMWRPLIQQILELLSHQ